VEAHVKNQTAFLTASTVRQWVASLQVEEFLGGKSKQSSARAAQIAKSSAGVAHLRASASKSRSTAQVQAKRTEGLSK
jgi:hypothetical protein